MRYLIYVAFFLLAVVLATPAEAGPLRNLASRLRGRGKAAVTRVLPPYHGNSGGCANGACRVR